MNCCLKFSNGETCPNSAIRRVELGARGLTFKVPICTDHFKLLQAQPKQSAGVGSISELFFGKK